MDFLPIIDDLSREVSSLRFLPPVAHVYNPLDYAGTLHRAYWERFGAGTKEVVFLGMNPGPWGMAQTGVPFGEVTLVRDWMGLDGPVGKPVAEHPKRPVRGLACHRSEVSGRRLWGWARDRFGPPEQFFRRFFVANYCPLLFLETGGRNRPPDRLPAVEAEPLFRACDRALRRTVELLRPRLVIGVGRWAEERARSALATAGISVGRVTHPSPANPAANRGWVPRVEKELRDLGVLP